MGGAIRVLKAPITAGLNHGRTQVLRYEYPRLLLRSSGNHEVMDGAGRGPLPRYMMTSAHGLDE